MIFKYIANYVIKFNYPPIVAQRALKKEAKMWRYIQPLKYLISVRRSLITKLYFKKLSSAAKEILENDIDENRLQALVNSVSYVFDMAVEGDIAEFGTMTGKSAVILATATSRNNSKYHNTILGTKKTFFFDSFEGLPEARYETDKNSHHVSTGIWGKGTCLGLSESQFEEIVSRYINRDFFHIYKGWFKDTVPTIGLEQKFSLIHIDGDLYESAIDVLDNLFEKGQVSEGAIILFDDWNCNRASPILGERKAFSEVSQKYNICFSDAGSYGFGGHKFIIHSYKKAE